MHNAPADHLNSQSKMSTATGGVRASQDELFELVYTELHGLATSKMASEPTNHTLQPTALVHEAYLRLLKERGTAWESRAQFFAAAAEAMRRILIERARRYRAVKHGAGRKRVSLEVFNPGTPEPDIDVTALSEALDLLAERDSRAAEVVKLRYFVGLTTEETAELLDISPRTVRNDWMVSKTWLHRQIATEEG